jgi:lysine 2,3-aminomutase
MESLIGHTSGFAIPRFVVDAPGGGGKIPIMPNYILSFSDDKVILRNYEGVITTYKEPDEYHAVKCDQKCDECILTHKLDPAEEIPPIGIEKLLSDYDMTLSLTPFEDLEEIEEIESKNKDAGTPLIKDKSEN